MKNSHLSLFLLPLLVSFTNVPGEGREVVRGQDPMTNEDALVVYFAGVEDLLADPRDEGLRRVFSMADARLLELPEELGVHEVPLPVIQLLCDVLGAPMSLRLDPIDGGDWSQGPQLTGQLTVHGTGDDLRTMATRFDELVRMMIPEEPTAAGDWAGLSSLPTPAGSVYYGVPADAADEFLLSFGAPNLAGLGLGSLDLPAGVKPIAAFKLDLARIQPTMEALLAMAGPDAEVARLQLESMGLLGENPMLITAAVGRGDDRLLFSSRAKNYVPYAKKTGALVTEPLTAADFHMVPADATSAALYKSDLSAVLDAVERMAPEEDILGMVRAMVGLDLESDLFNQLGTTTGFYTSESTGGGLGSLVVFLRVTGQEKLGETGEFLQGLINDFAMSEAQGYIRVREWAHGAQACTSLTFPGVPVPFEPSFALTEGWLLAAATPQALMAAVDHTLGTAPSLADAPGFRAADIGSREDLLSVSYTDTRATMAGGYGMVGMLCSALANGVRSPSDPERDPGLVLPPYRALLAGARPSVMVSRIEGDDLVTLGEGDASVLGNVTAAMGSSFGQVALLGVVLGFLVPTLMIGG